jgi:hypothetical protein
MRDVRFPEQGALLFHMVVRFERIHTQSGEFMTDADKTVLDTLERKALALLERATFSIRDEDHAHAVHSDAQAAVVALRPCLQRPREHIVVGLAPVVVNGNVMRRAQTAERRLNVVIDAVTGWNGLGEAGVFRDVARPSRR